MKRRILELKDYIGPYVGNCPITLQEIIVPVITKCDHVFEKDAILNWIQQSVDCPVCRNILNVIDENGKKVEHHPVVIVNRVTTQQILPRYILEFTPTNSSIDSSSTNSSSSSSSIAENDEEIEETESSSDYNTETSSSDDDI